MIKLSVKGFADFMTSGPAKQRNILRQYKYPDEDEAHARILYYREARDRIAGYHKGRESPDWLATQSGNLSSLAALSAGRTRARLNHNARALTAYHAHFGNREFEMLEDLVLRFTLEEVTITVAPDLHVREGGVEKMIRLEFGKDHPPERLIKIIAQLMYQTASDAGMNLKSSSVLCFDVPRGSVYKGAAVRSRLMKDIEATCQNISALWPSI
jgi:hypothetical protein